MASFFWKTDIDNRTSNEQRRKCLYLWWTLNQTMGRIHRQFNLFRYTMYHLELLLSVYGLGWVVWVFHIALTIFQSYCNLEAGDNGLGGRKKRSQKENEMEWLLGPYVQRKTGWGTYICIHPYIYKWLNNIHLDSFPIFKYIKPGKNETDCIL